MDDLDNVPEGIAAKSTHRDSMSDSSNPEQIIPESSPNPGHLIGESIEEFSKFCCLRSIPKDIKKRACHYLQDFMQQELTTLIPEIKDFYALIIYLGVIETRLPYGLSDPHLEDGRLDPPSVSVTDILQMTGVNINKLFQTLNAVKLKTDLPNTVLTHLKKMEKNYCVVAALFHTFNTRLCQSVFRDIKEDEDEEGSLPPIPETEGVSFRKKQCWTLFLLSRYHLLRDKPDLFPHFQLLLCCVEFVLRQTPSFLLNSPYDSIRFGYCNSQEAGITMLGKLAEEFEVASDGTLQLHLERTEPFFQSLLNKDGELDSDSLCEEYERIYHKEGDLDELHFLTQETHLMPISITPKAGNSQTSTLTKLLPGSMTPVRSAVSTIDLLQKSFGSGTEQLLEKYFKKCQEDPKLKIRTIIGNLRDQFVKAYQDVTKDNDTTMAEQRFLLGLKIYYTVLEALLNAESEKLTAQVLGTLLHREDFHKSLFTCSLEVVLSTYGQTYNPNQRELSSEESVLLFPWLLEVFSLHPYDFYKVIGNFVKIETRLPSDVVKHFHAIEIRILEQEAWREGSPVFEAMDEQREAGLATPPKFQSLSGSPMRGQGVGAVRTNGTLDLFLSPIKRSYHNPVASMSSSSSSSSNVASPSTTIGDAGSNSGSDGAARVASVPRQSQSLARFLSKVCHLGFSRLTELCTQLQLSEELQHKIWTCLEHCVTKLPHLLKNRHLDQILMCCIYSMGKVCVPEQEILFKTIVTKYKEMPHTKLETHKEVYMSEGVRESIISFYNRIFVGSIRGYIGQFSPQAGDRPRLSQIPKQAASPHYSIPGNKNFLISPLKESPFKAPQSPSKMTPTTKLLYCFPESYGGLDSAEKMKHFKHRLEMRKMGNSAKKRLNLDDMPGPEQSKARKVIF